VNLYRDAAGYLAVITFLSAACSPVVPPPDRVAEIDGRALSYGEFEEFLQHNSVAGTGVLASDVLSSLFDQFLDERLLACFAVDQLGLAEEIDSVSAAEALLEAQDEGVDEAAVANYYRQNETRFDLPERVYLRQLLFADQATAERARELWSGGAPYKSVVEGVVDAPSAHVGEEGEFSREQLPPVFADVLFALEDGEVSPVDAVATPPTEHLVGVVSCPHRRGCRRRRRCQSELPEPLERRRATCWR